MTALASDRLDRLPTIRYHYVLLVVSAVAFTFIMFNQFVLPLTIQELPRVWTVSYSLATFLTINAIGAAVGAIAFGMFADRMGRKIGMEVVLLLCSVPNGLLALVSNPSTFLALRFVGMLGVGGSQALFITYISEFTPPRLRGRYIGIVLSGMGWGPLLVSLSGLFVTPLLGWQGPYLLCFVPLLVLPFTHVYLYESPRYLLSQGKEDQADRVIRKLEEGAGIGPPALERARPDEFSRNRQRFRESFLTLFNPTWRLRTVLLAISSGLLIFSFSAWTSWFPSISVMIGYSLTATFQVLTITSLAQVAGFFAGAFLADAIGRRKAIFLSVPIMALANFASPFTVNIIEFGLVSSVLCFFVNVGSTALFSYVAENYPTVVRATATSVNRAIALVGLVAAPGSLGFLLQEYKGMTGILWSFVLMGVTTLIGAAAIYPIKVETAGLSLEATDGSSP